MSSATCGSKTAKRRAALAVCLAAITVCTLPGCRRTKSRPDSALVIPKKSVRRAASAAPSYNRYYVMWWIAHSTLETTVSRGGNPSEIDHLFGRAAEGLRLMDKFLEDRKRTKVNTFIDEYEDIRRTVNARHPSRRTTARLDRLETRIKKRLSPENVKIPKGKDTAE